MSGELSLWLGILTLFSLYGVLSGIELGVAMMRVEPRLAPAKPARRIFTPRLEITNILLALAVAGMFWLFEDAAATIVREMWPVLIVGLLALVLRAGLLLYLVISKTRAGGKLLNYLFALVCLVVPLTLGAVGIYMATGEQFWIGGAPAVLFGSLIVGLLALSFGFVYFVGGWKAPSGVVALSRVFNIALAVLMAIVLIVVLMGGDSRHLLGLPYAYLAVISASVVLAQSVFLAANKEWRMWWCLAALAAIAPFLVGLANYPYLIFPDIMIES